MGDTTITSTLGLTRLTPIFTPTNAVYPWAVMRRVSAGTCAVSHDGDPCLNLIRIEITVWDDNIKRAEQIIARIRALFAGFTGKLGGVSGVRFSQGAFSGPRSAYHPDTSSMGMQLDILGLLDEETIS